MAEPDDDLLTVDEVAERLKVNPQTVRNWIDAGKLPAVRLGTRRVRVQRTALETFVGIQAKPGLRRRATKRAAPDPAPTFDQDAVATALEEIGNGFLHLAVVLRGDIKTTPKRSRR